MLRAKLLRAYCFGLFSQEGTKETKGLRAEQLPNPKLRNAEVR
jgi:hypothetical protein